MSEIARKIIKAKNLIEQGAIAMKESLDAARRNLSITRLEMSKLCTFLGRDPWTMVPNAAHETCKDSSITVVITLFNYAQYIHECLDSVCAAKIGNIPGGFEVLVIDDGSSDHSARLVEQYIQQTDVPICLVKKLFNTGLADARNVGWRLARSPYIFILDADNWIYPNCLSVLYEAIHDSDYAAVYGIISRFDDQTGTGFDLVSYHEWNIEELVVGNYIDAMAMVRRNVLNQIDGYSTELMEIGWCGWEDYDLWLKIAQAGYQCKLVPQILSAYRLHPTSMISTTNSYSIFIAKHFLKKFPTLATLNRDSATLFGVPRAILQGNSVHPAQAAIVQPANVQPVIAEAVEAQSTEIKKLKKRLNRLESEREVAQQQLQDAQGRIEAMETSKFWKLRKTWFRVKKMVGLPSEE
ncbi:glycosyltransferase [Microcoleus sp. FACHB-1515]|uniref:glycosyltransferase n=1 Tax=Cyanophyceae TaxID=3028117 RepID=UPI0019BFF832|nr:glycosyltransferase [Microcoleus sp. FACHB-1515]MBD2088487.1 glycosyltransferase [Microcoleus sp. FACHB-1515]